MKSTVELYGLCIVFLETFDPTVVEGGSASISVKFTPIFSLYVIPNESGQKKTCMKASSIAQQITRSSAYQCQEPYGVCSELTVCMTNKNCSND